MDRLFRDLRVAVRRLRQNLTFTALAVLTLALGIGANTAIFSVINAVLLRPLPGVARGSELVSLNQTYNGNTFPALSFPNYRDMRDRNTVLAGLSAYRIVPASLGLRARSERLWGYLVTGNYFDVLGVSASMGRVFRPEDDVKPGGHPLAILSYGCWRKRFGGDPGVIGRKVKFNGMDFTILGIAPRGFLGTELFFAPEVFFPMMMQKELEGNGYLDEREASNMFVVGRRKPGVGVARAEAGLNSVARALAREYPKEDAGMKITLAPPGLAGSWIRGPVVGFAAALFGVSCLVLLVACTNLASMLLARGADRRKEIALRLAIGAGRGGLLRQLLTENLAVALLGGAVGALLAVWITDALSAWRPPMEFPLVISAAPDGRVFFFALLVSVAATLLFGLVPALQATRTDLVSALKNEAISEHFRRWHLRDYLVATQVGLSVVLLVCSVLVVRSLQRALQAPIGYNPKGAVTASFDLNTQGYTEAQGREFQQRLLQKVRSIPGIESAALADWLPLTLNSSSDGIFVEGEPPPKATEAPIAYAFSVSPAYFRTMQTRILGGREFDARDRKGGTRVAVVNEAFVKQILKGRGPFGRRFNTGPDTKPLEIVGVAQDGKYFSLAEPAKPAFWTPLEITYSANASLVARTKLDGAQALRLIQSAVRDLDPDVALFGTGTMVERLSLPLFPTHIAAAVLGAFGVLALILAATGIYGVMAYAISSRTREIGIRMAVGAGRAQVLEIVARRALILTGAGTAIGLGTALAGARVLGQLLYGVDPADPLTFATVLLLMAAIAALACWVPASRALRINPITALRQE